MIYYLQANGEYDRLYVVAERVNPHKPELVRLYYRAKASPLDADALGLAMGTQVHWDQAAGAFVVRLPQFTGPTYVALADGRGAKPIRCKRIPIPNPKLPGTTARDWRWRLGTWGLAAKKGQAA